jgi:D-glycero-D-manno-heptose 1,7-bisphosphate phosphatase
MKINKLIILDRDGVINYDSPNFIKSAEEWQPLPGSITAIANLSKAGFTIVVASNQSGIGRGLFTQENLNQMHDKMLALVTAAGGKIDGIFFCQHIPEDYCTCRKPNPGLIHQILKKFGVDTKNNDTKVNVIGDSLRDLQAAQSANCHPILVTTGNGCKTLDTIQNNSELNAQFADLLVCADLLQASEVIIEKYAHTLVS